MTGSPTNCSPLVTPNKHPPMIAASELPEAMAVAGHKTLAQEGNLVESPIPSSVPHTAAAVVGADHDIRADTWRRIGITD